MKLFEDGDPCFAPMLNALFAAFRGTAVMSGCEASATGTSRTVSITAGSVQINGEVIAVSAGSVTLDAGSTFDRYDLVSVNASGSKIVTKGATKRKCPTQPANTCLLAIVFVPAGATVIATGNVYDARMDAPRLSVLNIATSYIYVDKITFTRKMSVADINGTIFYTNSNTYSVSSGQPPFTNIPTITVPPGLVEGSTITIAADIFSPSYRSTTLTCFINGVSTAALSFTPEVDGWGSSSNTVTIKSGDVISFALSPPGYLGGGAVSGSVKNITLRGNLVDMPMISIANDPVWPPSI